jgi:hypothetical protein
MTTRTTSADLEYQLKNLIREFDHLGLPSANLMIANGSKTYGRAYRLHYRDPQHGGLMTVPAIRSDYLGMTRREAVDALKFLIDGLRIARSVQQ